MNMVNLLRHVSLKHVTLQKTQLLVAMSGLCLGVAAMVAIDVVNKSVLHSFAESIDHITGRASLSIEGSESGFPEEILDRVLQVAGVEYAVPVIETTANLAQGSERPFMILGIDALQDDKIRSYSLEGNAADIPDPLLFLAKKDSILLSKTMAVQEGIKIDQQIRVQTVQGVKTFRVRGLLNPEGPAKVSGGYIAIMDIFGAQASFGLEGRINRIDVSFLPGQDTDTMEKRISKVLPEGYSVDTPAVRTRQVTAMLARFQGTMGFVSLMVLFVAMYLIYNTIAISVVHRRKEIGILRALGAKRREIVSLFYGETLIFSVLGSTLGVAVGIGLARLAVNVVAQSISEIYLQTAVTTLTISWPLLLRDALLGIATSLAAAAFPAIASVRFAPLATLRPAISPTETYVPGSKVKAVALLSFLLSTAALVAFTTASARSPVKTPTTVIFAAVALIIGFSLVTPTILQKAISFYHGFLSARLGAAGRLAGLNLQKNVSRNGVAVAAICFSIGLYICSANAMYSVRASMFDWIDSIIRADLLISSGHPLASGGAASIPMPDSLSREIAQVAGVKSVEVFRKGYVNYLGKKILLEIFDVGLRMEYCPGLFTKGNRTDIAQDVPNSDLVVVNEGFAAKYHVDLGDSITLPTPNGPVRFGIAGVTVSYTSDSGAIWMDINTYRRHWQDSLVDTFEILVDDKAKIPEIRQDLLQRLGKERHLFILPAWEFKQEIRKILDHSFVVNNAVNIIVLIIAGSGIIITLLASVLERTREIGVLRAMGMTKGQIARVLIIESALLGAIGGLLGVILGIPLGWISLEAFFRLDYGESIVYHIHLATMCGAVFLAVGLATMAGFYPARRAAGINIVEALSYE